MKRALLAASLTLGTIVPANADVYVAVDAQGNAVGGPVMCDSATCADGSQYSNATLQPGQHYVLQNRGSAGIGGDNPGTSVKADVATQTWTISTNETVVRQFTPEREISVAPVIVKPDTSTVVDSSTVLFDSTTALSDFTFPDWWAEFLKFWTRWSNLFTNWIL